MIHHQLGKLSRMMPGLTVPSLTVRYGWTESGPGLGLPSGVVVGTAGRAAGHMIRSAWAPP
eukprot:753366-Hanusia_phi.AAC.1